MLYGLENLRAKITALPSSSCVTGLFNPSAPQFPHLCKVHKTMFPLYSCEDDTLLAVIQQLFTECLLVPGSGPSTQRWETVWFPPFLG